MSDKMLDRAVTRRDFIRVGSGLAGVAIAGPLVYAGEQSNKKDVLAASKPLPMRPLGKSGIKVTALSLGTSFNFTQRILDHVYVRGVRCMDTSVSYGRGQAEKRIAKWFERTGKRKEMCLVTKDHPRRGKGKGDPSLLLTQIDKRLEALKTDYIDMFFIHGFGVGSYGQECLNWLKSKEFKQVCEKLKKSGKVKLVGFSCHNGHTPAYLTASAQGGIIDAIMFGYSGALGKKDEALNRAMDACHKAGVGLIAMKTGRGVKQITLDENSKLTAHQAVIQAVLSDERIACVCSEMQNFTQIDQNTEAVRQYKKPMTTSQIERLRSAILAAGVSFCPGCEGCRQDVTGVADNANEIARYLTYYEQDGDRRTARRLYRALPAEDRRFGRDDLEAARQACANHVDFASVIERAERMLA